MRYSELFHKSVRKLEQTYKKNQCDGNPALDIQLIIEKTFGFSRSQFWVTKNDPITNKTQLYHFYRCFRRLEKSEPVAFILREKYFFSEKFYLNKNVLIPRPETENLVEKAIEILKKKSDVLDIGAGCGNISVILAKKTHSRILATELNPKSLYVLRKNIKHHNLKNKILPCCTDLFPVQKKQFDLIISNPPYLSESEWNQLPIQITKYEPKIALVSGPRGDETIKRIIRQSKEFLKPKGHLLFEIGYKQKNIVKKLLEEAHYKNIDFFMDYNNIDRIALAQK